MKEIEKLLLDKRKEILTRWFERILATYPSDARNFYQSQEDAIANPVGSSISRGMEGVFDCLVKGGDLESQEVSAFLDKIIRIRAVQEFTPEAALGFIFDLKSIIRDSLGKYAREEITVRDLLTCESRIDKLALLAFNIYMQCREKIYDLRAREFKNRTVRIVQRACQIWEARGEPLPEELKEE